MSAPIGIRSFLQVGSRLRSSATVRASSGFLHQNRKLKSGLAFQGSPAQTTDTVLMIRPKYFNYNPETAETNDFQSNSKDHSPEKIAELALKEADKLVGVLRENDVHVIEKAPLPEQKDCPDAVFPNNWVSFHEGRIAVYPMLKENRRRERRYDLVKWMARHLGAVVVDYTSWEERGHFLEGTGSMVLDRENKIAYVSLSERTHPIVLDQFCKDFGYKAVKFRATWPKDGSLVPVYHTNVICSVGDTFALLCSSCIRDPVEKWLVRESLTNTGREVVDIAENQVYDSVSESHKFASNSLQLRNSSGEKLLVMSSEGYNCLRHDQVETLKRHVDHIIHSPLKNIQKYGGGGARCMLAEVFYSSNGKSPREL